LRLGIGRGLWSGLAAASLAVTANLVLNVSNFFVDPLTFRFQSLQCKFE